MDISQFDSIKTNTRKLELEDHEGNPLMYDTGETEASGEFEEDGTTPIMQSVNARVTITLVSSDSHEYTSVYKSQVTSTIGKIGRRGKARKNAVTGDTVAEDKLELLTACTKSWVGWQDGGKDFPCNPKNALALYTRLPFVREQVEEYVHERGNF